MKKLVLVVLSALVFSGCALGLGFREDSSGVKQYGLWVNGSETHIKDGFHNTKSPQ